MSPMDMAMSEISTPRNTPSARRFVRNRIDSGIGTGVGPAERRVMPDNVTKAGSSAEDIGGLCQCSDE